MCAHTCAFWDQMAPVVNYSVSCSWKNNCSQRWLTWVTRKKRQKPRHFHAVDVSFSGTYWSTFTNRRTAQVSSGSSQVHSYYDGLEYFTKLPKRVVSLVFHILFSISFPKKKKNQKQQHQKKLFVIFQSCFTMIVIIYITLSLSAGRHGTDTLGSYWERTWKDCAPFISWHCHHTNTPHSPGIARNKCR